MKINSNPEKGFTLIELMVVVSLIAILASLAAPSFGTAIANQRVNSAAQELQSILLFARSEAVYKRTDSTLTANGQTWTAKTSSQIAREAVLPSVVTVTPNGDSADGVEFNSAGIPKLISGGSGDYRLSISATNANRAQCVSVTRAGLVRQQRIAPGASCT